MAVSFERVTVSTAAVALNAAGTTGTKLAVKNAHATDALILGDSSVAAGRRTSSRMCCAFRLDRNPVGRANLVGAELA